MKVIGHGAPVLSPIRRNRSNYQNLYPGRHEPQQQQQQQRENMISMNSSFVDDCNLAESAKKMDESLVVEPKEKIESMVVDTKPKKKKIEKKKNGNSRYLSVFGGTKRLGLDLIYSSPPLASSNGVSKKSGHMYAGSGFVWSPEPGSLPLPSFSLPCFNIRNKKGSVVVDDTVSATKDIRRMLGLDGVLV